MSISIQSTTNNPYAIPSLLNSASQTNATSPFANLNLTSTQNTQIQSILQNAQSQSLSFSQVQSQINSVLSPTQQTAMQSNVQKSQAHHHHHRSGGSSDATSSIASNTDAFGVPNVTNASSDTSTPTSSIAGSFADLLDTAGNGNPSSLLSQLTNPFSTIAATIAAQSQFQAVSS
jgi:hypothetical protein